MPAISVDTSTGATVVRLSGNMVSDTLHAVEQSFARVSASSTATEIDLSHLEALDIGGACLIIRLQRRLATEGVATEIIAAKPDHRRLLTTVDAADFTDATATPPARSIADLVSELGEHMKNAGAGVASLLSFLGLVLSRGAATILHPRRLRVTALFAQMQQTGLNAVPIVALMGFLIGIVLAYQGAAQLRQFGAEVFVVELISVSVLRELGILLTAIIVAGRSGSAFAAAIGSMKVNEEIDAMRTLGLDPVDVLVLPRLIALTLMLPVLGLIANVAALIGGALMSWVELGVSPGMFLTRFYETTDIWHLAVGMIKAPVFAFIIGIVACWQGLQVGGSAESVGQRTTASVVQAIFLVIVMDAVFSIFFAEIGV